MGRTVNTVEKTTVRTTVRTVEKVTKTTEREEGAGKHRERRGTEGKLPRVVQGAARAIVVLIPHIYRIVKGWLVPNASDA